MALPKSVMRAMRAVQSGEQPSDEDRATVANHLKRLESGERRIGRPPNAFLVQFRKAFGPVSEFEALRSRGMPQADAEEDVMRQFNISQRTLWNYRKRLDLQFPGIVGSMRESCNTIRALGEDSNKVPFKERVGFIFGQLFQANMQQHGTDGTLMFADMLENERYSDWYVDLYMEALAKTRLAIVDAFTPRAGQLPFPGSLPANVIEGVLLTIAAGVFDSCIATAINSRLIQWKSS